MPYFRKWKLQPTKIPTAAEQWACTKYVLFSHFAIELPGVSFDDFFSLSLLCQHDMLFVDLVFPPHG
jgi:hypothetical protein